MVRMQQSVPARPYGPAARHACVRNREAIRSLMEHFPFPARWKYCSVLVDGPLQPTQAPSQPLGKSVMWFLKGHTKESHPISHFHSQRKGNISNVSLTVKTNVI